MKKDYFIFYLKSLWKVGIFLDEYGNTMVDIYSVVQRFGVGKIFEDFYAHQA